MLIVKKKRGKRSKLYVNTKYDDNIRECNIYVIPFVQIFQFSEIDTKNSLIYILMY